MLKIVLLTLTQKTALPGNYFYIIPRFINDASSSAQAQREFTRKQSKATGETEPSPASSAKLRLHIPWRGPYSPVPRLWGGHRRTSHMLLIKRDSVLGHQTNHPNVMMSGLMWEF